MTARGAREQIVVGAWRRVEGLLGVDLTRGWHWWRVRARGEDSGDGFGFGEFKIAQRTQWCVQKLDSSNFSFNRTCPDYENTSII